MKRIPLFASLIAAACCSIVPAGASAKAPVSKDRIVVPGLQAPAEILVDRWGVSHIYAKSANDAFFAQGWNAARDRLWQIDLWRRNGLGELAAVLGEKYAEKDRATRLFVYRGDMEKEWAAYGPDARRETEAFVAGINAFVAATRKDAALLPAEFKLAGYQPAVWKAEDVVRVRNATLVYSAVLAADRAQAVCKDGSPTKQAFPAFAMPWTLRVPEGLDMCSIPKNVLEKYSLAMRPVTFAPSPTGQAMNEVPSLLDPRHSLAQGSNNWVIGPDKSATGRPVVANDPHRSLDVPSLRYITHLSAPGLDVIGAGEPSIPGIALGHNQDVAMGLTVFFIAQEDLYVYETNPANPDQYRYEGGWEQMETVTESLAVRGAANQQITLKFTRHGPVVMEDPAMHRAYAVKAAWLGTGGAPYMGSMRYLRAKTVEEVSAALKHWGEPGLNHVVADTKGKIGWFPSGFTPKRTNTDGILPLPGDGRYEWDGLLEPGKLPSEINPGRGYIATANQMNLPADYPNAEQPVNMFHADPARFNRITEVFDRLPKISIADSAKMQNDFISIPGRRLAALLGTVRAPAGELADTAQWLAGWNGNTAADSAQAALYEVWRSRYLFPAFMEKFGSSLTPGAKRFSSSFNISHIIDMLEKPGQEFGADPVRARDALMLKTLGDALADTKTLLGPDRSRWQWGKLATTVLQHRLSPLAHEALRAKMNVGPLPKGGDGNVVGVADFDSKTFRTLAGASVRLIMDVGKWDNSLAVNTPGQSGDWTSPHYSDLFKLWNAGDYFPLLYSRQAVEKATQHRIELVPAAQ
jgi:penicillin amidase